MNKNLLLIGISLGLLFFLFNQKDIASDSVGVRAIEKNKPCVVGINAKKIESSINNMYHDLGSNIDFIESNDLGSGVIISSDGYIITNAHVVEDAINISITLDGGRSYEGIIKGIDHLTDLALIQIIDYKFPENDSNFPYVKLGNSDKLVVGEPVFALGNPLGLFNVSNQPTATAGIISGINIDFGLKSEGYVYQNMIQTDAAINAGSSGGPLINSEGDVIGINTFIMTASDYSSGSIGIGFSIPINRVKAIIGDIKKIGQINRDYATGLKVKSIDKDTMQLLRLKSREGVVVRDVEKDSPGDNAGIKVGDIILKVEDRKVNSGKNIKKVIDEGFHRTGDIIKLIILRNEKSIELELELANPKNK